MLYNSKVCGIHGYENTMCTLNINEALCSLIVSTTRLQDLEPFGSSENDESHL